MTVVSCATATAAAPATRLAATKLTTMIFIFLLHKVLELKTSSHRNGSNGSDYLPAKCQSRWAWGDPSRLGAKPRHGGVMSNVGVRPVGKGIVKGVQFEFRGV